MLPPRQIGITLEVEAGHGKVDNDHDTQDEQGSKAQRVIEAKAESATAKTKNSKAKSVPPLKKVNAALSKPLQVSDQLAVVVGKGPMPRTEVVSAVWSYIRKHNLQNPDNKREILADEALKAVFGQDKVTMFEMNKFLSAHLS